MPKTASISLFSSSAWRVLCIVSCIAIFMADPYTPPGYAHGTLYLVLVIMVAASRDDNFVILMATLSTLFIIAGATLGPMRPLSVLIANRTTSILELVIFAWACVVVNRPQTPFKLPKWEFKPTRDLFNTTFLQPRADSQPDPAVASLFTETKYSFQQLADSLPLIIWVADAQGQVCFSNRALGTYAGLGQEQLYPRAGWGSTVSPIDMPQCEAAWLQAVREGTDFSVQARIRRHDGNYRWHLVQARPVRDDNGKIRMWCGSALDIHELKAQPE